MLKTFDEKKLFKISPIINSINPISWWRTAKYIKAKNPSKVFIRFWMPFFAPCLGIIGKYLKRNKIPVFGIVDHAIAHEKRLGDTMLVNYFLNKLNNILLSVNKKMSFDRSFKGDSFEGGIRTPAIAYWPNTIKQGTKSSELIH